MFEGQNNIILTGRLLYMLLALSSIIGALALYVWKTRNKDIYCHIKKLYSKFDDNREDHKEIFEVLRGKVDKK